MGSPMIQELLIRQYPDVRAPAISTIHAVLDRHGLVTASPSPIPAVR